MDKIENYISPDIYIPNSDLIKLVRELVPVDWNLHQNGIWIGCHKVNKKRELPKQGWKIHISATIYNYKEILEKTTIFCVENQLQFKFLADENALRDMNSKHANRGSSGKFITIYPINKEEFINVIEELYILLKEFEGPYILSDRPYKDSKTVYYRYGGFISILNVKLNGELDTVIYTPTGEYYSDLRLPYFNLPNWESDPFTSHESVKKKNNPGLKNGEYIIEKPIHFSNGGGVYIAKNSKGEKVLIKEARKWSVFDKRNKDSVERLNREYNFLRMLENSGFTPKPIEIFTEWEHTFLVEEYIDGMELGRYIVDNSVTNSLKSEYNKIAIKLGKTKKMLLSIIDKVEYFHKKGVVFGDLSIKNILVTNSNEEIKFIDLEGCWKIDSEESTIIYTRGFGTGDNFDKGIENDIYAIGAIIITSFTFLPITKINTYSPETFIKMLDEIICDLGFSPSFKNILLKSMDKNPLNRPTLSQIKSEVNQLSIDNISINTKIDKYEIKNTIKGIEKFIKSELEFKHNGEIIIPSDQKVFFTNPLSLAYGMGGITYSLNKLGIEIPDTLRSWMIMKFEVDKNPPGLYLGLAGFSWFFLDLEMKEFGEKILEAAFEHPLITKQADIFYGASGVGMAALKYYQTTKKPIWLERAKEIANYLIATKREYKDGSVYWVDNENNTYTGYARGASGVALYLLYLGVLSKEQKYLELGERAIKFDLNWLGEIDNHLSVYRGKINILENKPEENILSHSWFDGTAGLVTTLLRYYHVTKKEEYYDLLLKLLPDLERKYTSFPNLIHGLAGLGNALIDAKVFLRDEKYLEEANKICRGINLFKIEKTNGIVYPGDKLDMPSSDFISGSSGIALFLNRLVNNLDFNFNFLLDEILEVK